MKIKHLNIDNFHQLDHIKKLLKRYPNTTAFMLPQYLKAVKDTYSFNVYYLICYSGNGLGGIASFYVKLSLSGKNLLESIPGGFWAKDKSLEESLIKKLRELASYHNLKGPYFKDLYKPLCSLNDPKILSRAVIELPESKEDLMKLYSRNIQRDIKNAKRNELKVTESNKLGDFYKIWSQRMRDLGTPVIPFTFFKNMKHIFGDDMTLLLVKKETRYIGGVILLHFGDIITDPYLGCLSETFKYCPNSLLYHEMLCWGVDHGYKCFDLGRSQPCSGNERFKLRFGAKLKSLYSYEASRFNGDNPFVKVPTFCWKKLPLFIANYLGPKIRKNIPFG